MRTVRILTIGIALLFVQACSHPIEIVGEGDVMSSTGDRTCLLENFLAGDDVCSKNYVTGFDLDQLPALVPEDYAETYNPVPRTGWKFNHWGYPYCPDATHSNYECSFNVPAATVQQLWGKTMPPLKAVFTPADCDSGCLREFAEGGGVKLGFGINEADLSDPVIAKALEVDANLITPSNAMKFGVIHPQRDIYDFSSADRIVAHAQSNRQTVYGHVLIWHLQMPGWLDPGSPWVDNTDAWRAAWTREELIEVMRDHIHTVMRHCRDNFPGVVQQWEVVNEAFNADGSRRRTIWQQVIGDDYIELAFRFAREADPNAKLYLNDFYDSSTMFGEFILGRDPTYDESVGASSLRTNCDDVAKCVAIRALAQDFVQRGVPIDGIGFMAHHFGWSKKWPYPPDYIQLTEWTKDLNLSWALTEVDVALRNDIGDNRTTSEEDQAKRFELMVKACLDSGNCNTVVFWGATDATNWLRDARGFYGATLRADDGSPKPAYWKVWELLYNYLHRKA